MQTINSNPHDALIQLLCQAWETLDATIIEPLLVDNLHYFSWFVFEEMHDKEAYMNYIRGKFQAIKEQGGKPLVKMVINKHTGESAVELTQRNLDPVIICIKEKKGMIIEMWMQWNI